MNRTSMYYRREGALQTLNPSFRHSSAVRFFFLLLLRALFECWRRVCCGQSSRSGFGVSTLPILSLLIQLFRRVSCGRSSGSEFPHPSFTAFFALDFLKQLRRQAIKRLQISLQKIAYCQFTIGFPYWDPWIAD